MSLTHKEMTAHIRKRLRVANIDARVRMFDACGIRYIQVITPSYEARWSSSELARIAAIASANHLTGAQRSPVSESLMSQLTGITQINFEFHGEEVAA